MADTKFKSDVHRKTAAEWSNSNVYLARGDVGIESDTGRRKVGVGLRWEDTDYDLVVAGTVAAIVSLSMQEYVETETDASSIYVVTDPATFVFVGDKPLTRNLDYRAAGKFFWPEFRDSMANTVAGPAMANPVFEEDATPLDINGGCVLPDGRVFLLSKSGAVGISKIWEPSTNTYTDVGPRFSDPAVLYGTHAGALPLPDGTVFIVPYWAGAPVKIYDPLTDTATVVAEDWTLPLNQGCYHAIPMANGDIFMPPRKMSNAVIYHWKTQTVTQVPGPWASPPGFRGGVLLADGRIFCAPYEKNQPYIYDPTDGSWFVTPPTSGNYHTGNCVLLHDGRVFMPGFNGVPNLYNPVNNTMVQTASFTGTISAALMPNGKVFVPPWNGIDFRVYDPAADTVEVVGSLTGGEANGRYNTTLTLPDGRVACWCDGTYDPAPAVVVYGSTENAFDRNVVLSPYRNGGR